MIEPINPAPEQSGLVGQTPIEPVPFSGMELFSTDHAKRLGTLIGSIKGFQARAVIEVSEQAGVGWQPNGFPDTKGVAQVERIIKTRGCAMIALETARALGGSLSTEEIVELVEQNGGVYESIPQAVRTFLQQKQSK